MGNTFGRIFRISTWGESHGKTVGVTIDGCPPGIAIGSEEIQRDLLRRRPGQSNISTQRKEGDQIEILSGVQEGLSLGTPIAMLVRNSDARGKDYSEMAEKYRPSHADYTYQAKYGIRAKSGGGRASARETIGRVAAGAIAKKILASEGIEILAWVNQVCAIRAQIDLTQLSMDQIEANPVRCPDPQKAREMEAAILAARKDGDSLGGIVSAIARGVPPGLGAPVFDKLDADLAKAMISLPAAKGFESGSGFDGIRLRGSEHNDAFYTDEKGRVRCRTNYSGGIQGGISNGENITINVAFKPTATIMKDQETITQSGESTVLQGKGRHDPCVLPRAVPIVEAMMALVLADHLLLHRAQCGIPSS